MHAGIITGSIRCFVFSILSVQLVGDLQNLLTVSSRASHWGLPFAVSVREFPMTGNKGALVLNVQGVARRYVHFCRVLFVARAVLVGSSQLTFQFWQRYGFDLIVANFYLLFVLGVC